MDEALEEAKESVVCAIELVRDDMSIGDLHYGTVTAFMPMFSDTCPFCLTGTECSDCQYAQSIGYVCEDDESPWKTFADAVDEYVEDKEICSVFEEDTTELKRLIQMIEDATNVREFLAAKLNVITYMLSLMENTKHLRELAVNAYGNKTML